jgi:hypothetical protein
MVLHVEFSWKQTRLCVVVIVDGKIHNICGGRPKTNFRHYCGAFCLSTSRLLIQQHCHNNAPGVVLSPLGLTAGGGASRIITSLSSRGPTKTRCALETYKPQTTPSSFLLQRRLPIYLPTCFARHNCHYSSFTRQGRV